LFLNIDHVLEYDLQGQIQGQQSLLSNDPNSFYRGNFPDNSGWYTDEYQHEKFKRRIRFLNNLENNTIVYPNVKLLELSEYAGKKLHYHKKKC